MIAFTPEERRDFARMIADDIIKEGFGSIERNLQSFVMHLAAKESAARLPPPHRVGRGAMKNADTQAYVEGALEDQGYGPREDGR